MKKDKKIYAEFTSMTMPFTMAIIPVSIGLSLVNKTLWINYIGVILVPIMATIILGLAEKLKGANTVQL